MTESTTAPPAPTPARRNQILGHLFAVGQILVPGAYAWAVSVAPAASSMTANAWARITALLAFSSLVSGTFVHKDRPRLGYALGIWSFLAFSALTWLSNLDAIRVDRLDPLRAAAATVGWLLFSLGWGTPWRAGVHPEDNPRAQLHPKLEPRRPATLRTPLTVAIGATGAAACLLLAWRAAELGGRVVALMANDSTVEAGSWGPGTVEKILRIQETARDLRCPLVYLVDSAGARITDQVKMFPGRRGAGRIFYNQVEMSGFVPQVCLLFGPSAAGGAYIPAFCDVVVMVEGNATDRAMGRAHHAALPREATAPSPPVVLFQLHTAGVPAPHGWAGSIAAFHEVAAATWGLAAATCADSHFP